MRLLLPEGHCDTAQAFKKLKAACEEPKKMNAHWRDWMSDSTWAMMKQRTSLRRAGQLRRAEGQCMQRAIHAALKRDRAPHTAQVGKLIDTDLAEGNIHEAFRHLNQLPQKESSGKLCGSRSRQLSASAPSKRIRRKII